MYSKALNLSFILALIVVILGAYTRLADAGLGCPDWPGCYGQLLVPEVISAEYDRPLDIAKAWTEMIHRYAASILGLSIVVIFLLAIFRRPETLRSVKLPTALLLLVCLSRSVRDVDSYRTGASRNCYDAPLRRLFNNNPSLLAAS